MKNANPRPWPTPAWREALLKLGILLTGAALLGTLGTLVARLSQQLAHGLAGH